MQEILARTACSRETSRLSGSLLPSKRKRNNSLGVCGFGFFLFSRAVFLFDPKSAVFYFWCALHQRGPTLEVDCVYISVSWQRLLVVFEYPIIYSMLYFLRESAHSSECAEIPMTFFEGARVKAILGPVGPPCRIRAHFQNGLGGFYR